MTGQNAQPGNEQSAGSTAEWRDDLDALQFPVPGHDAHCLVHRRAFRALVGGSTAHNTVEAPPPAGAVIPDRTACLTFFARNTVAFHAAARAKILRQAIPAGKNLHLNSRDIRRALEGEAGGTAGRACRVLGG